MGPTTENIDVVCELLRAGMNVARFNFSHSNHAYHKLAMERVREASKITGIPCALLLDTKGPEIRTGEVAGDGKIDITVGETFLLTNDDCLSVAFGSPVAGGAGKPGRISLSWK